MAGEHTVFFDLGPTASGAYYVNGEYVMYHGLVCVVAGTARLSGTRFRASLRPVPHPTPQQRRQAQDWQRRQDPPARPPGRR